MRIIGIRATAVFEGVLGRMTCLRGTTRRDHRIVVGPRLLGGHVALMRGRLHRSPRVLSRVRDTAARNEKTEQADPDEPALHGVTLPRWIDRAFPERSRGN